MCRAGEEGSRGADAPRGREMLAKGSLAEALARPRKKGVDWVLVVRGSWC